MEDVKKDIEAVKSKLSQNIVTHTPQYLRQRLILWGVLSSGHHGCPGTLSGHCQGECYDDILRYNTILRQTRGLAEDPVLQRVLKLLGSKEEIINY